MIEFGVNYAVTNYTGQAVWKENMCIFAFAIFSPQIIKYIRENPLRIISRPDYRVKSCSLLGRNLNNYLP